MVVVVGGTSVNSGRNVSFVDDVVDVVVVVEVVFLFDFPKKKAIVDFLVVVVLRDDMMEVGNLRSLVLDVVDGVGRSRVVASSSFAKLPSCSRGCWVVVSSFRKNIHIEILTLGLANIIVITHHRHSGQADGAREGDCNGLHCGPGVVRGGPREPSDVLDTLRLPPRDLNTCDCDE